MIAFMMITKTENDKLIINCVVSSWLALSWATAKPYKEAPPANNNRIESKL